MILLPLESSVTELLTLDCIRVVSCGRLFRLTMRLLVPETLLSMATVFAGHLAPIKQRGTRIVNFRDGTFVCLAVNLTSAARSLGMLMWLIGFGCGLTTAGLSVRGAISRLWARGDGYGTVRRLTAPSIPRRLVSLTMTRAIRR